MSIFGTIMVGDFCPGASFQVGPESCLNLVNAAKPTGLVSSIRLKHGAHESRVLCHQFAPPTDTATPDPNTAVESVTLKKNPAGTSKIIIVFTAALNELYGVAIAVPPLV